MEVLVRNGHEDAEEPGAPGDLPDAPEHDLQELLLGDAEAAILVLADVVVVPAIPTAPLQGLSTCCRILADMGRTWSKRSSCRSHPELVIIATSTRSKDDSDL